ncbi:MAG: RNA polymerase sigma factor [Sediminibacterium sp.]
MTNWSDIYILYHEKLIRHAIGYIKDKQSAEDVVQDIFLRLLQKNLSPLFMDHAEKYLKTAVYRECMSYFRRKVLQQSKNEWHDTYAVSANYTEEHFNYRELHALHIKAIKALPQKEKEVYILRNIQGLTKREAASILGKSSLTVKDQYEHSCQKVRKLLKSQRA